MTFPSIDSTHWRAAMHRGRSERNVAWQQIQAKLSDTFPAGYDITAARQFVLKSRDAAMRQLTSGVGPRRNVSNASETGATRDSRERPALISAQEKAAGFQPAAKQIQKRIK
jgi:hypothetical protein